MATRLPSVSRALHQRCRSVLASGHGKFGALGQGNFNDVPATAPVEVHYELSDGDFVKKLSVGWGHSAVLTDGGDVFLHGQFLNFRDIAYSSMFSKTSWLLGKFQPKSKQLRVHTPFKLNGPGLGACKDIATSAALTAIIAEDGTLYTFGENSHEQCGVGETDSLIWPPTAVRNLHGIAASSVALGINHGIIRTSSGECYSWGQNTVGQLGVGLSHSQVACVNAAKRVPSELFGGDAVVKVSAGMVHSAVLTEAGQVYVWGKHMSDVRDEVAGNNYHHQFRPRLLEELAGQRVVDIASSQFSVCALLEDGAIYLLDRVPQHKQDKKKTRKDFVNTAFFTKSRKARSALACDTGVLKPEGKVVAMRDGFHSCTLVTSGGNVFELNSSLEPRKLEFDNPAQGQSSGRDQRVIDAVMGWEHSLWLVDSE